MARAVTSGGQIQIVGLRDFVIALKAVDAKYPEVIRKANYELAREIVSRSKDKAKTEAGVAAKAAKSLRAGQASSNATVSGGGPRYPYFWGAEFGAKQYRQFDAWRGNQWEGWSGGPGYFLHPTIRDNARALVADYMKQLDELHSIAFPD